MLGPFGNDGVIMTQALGSLCNTFAIMFDYVYIYIETIYLHIIYVYIYIYVLYTYYGYIYISYDTERFIAIIQTHTNRTGWPVRVAPLNPSKHICLLFWTGLDLHAMPSQGPWGSEGCERRKWLHARIGSFTS